MQFGQREVLKYFRFGQAFANTKTMKTLFESQSEGITVYVESMVMTASLINSTEEFTVE